jgi:hypothetical protein
LTLLLLLLLLVFLLMLWLLQAVALLHLQLWISQLASGLVQEPMSLVVVVVLVATGVALAVGVT